MLGCCTVGEVLESPPSWSFASGCGREAFAVARARGVSLGFDDPDAYVHAFGSKIPGARPSLVLDLLAGRRTEIDFINGAIPRVGREVGVPTPNNDAVTALVKAIEARVLGYPDSSSSP